MKRKKKRWKPPEKNKTNHHLAEQEKEKQKEKRKQKGISFPIQKKREIGKKEQKKRKKKKTKKKEKSEKI